MPELRQAIAEYVGRTRAIEVRPRSRGGAGGKPILFFTILALIDDGDEVIYPNPAIRSTSP